MMTTSRKNKKTVATTRLLLQKGLEIKAKLQKHKLCLKLSSFDYRKVGEEWKLQIPDLSLDILDKCSKLVQFESLSVQKSLSNPLADKFRLEIDGVVDKSNTSILISINLLQFNFRHQVDVHNVISNDFMTLVKWLRILHGQKSNNFDIVHPDLLIFIRQFDIEFQVMYWKDLINPNAKDQRFPNAPISTAKAPQTHLQCTPNVPSMYPQCTLNAPQRILTASSTHL